MLIYFIGCILVLLLGFLMNKSKNYLIQMPFGGVALLALFSWVGLVLQLIVLILQVDFKWFNPNDYNK